jgi:hypothetical protein
MSEDDFSNKLAKLGYDASEIAGHFTMPHFRVCETYA